MACCRQDSAGCASLSPDDCCAAGEQRQNVETLVTEAPIVDQPLVGRGSLIRLAPRAAADDARSETDRSATYLLDSVFRI